MQKNASSKPLAQAVDLQYPQGWVRSTPQSACGAEYRNNGYNPPTNTSAYCAPHCGPSASVRTFSRATWVSRSGPSSCSTDTTAPPSTDRKAPLLRRRCMLPLMQGYFSAVCHATGAALLRDTGRPQGMIESCWGGTRVEPWTPAAVSPPDAPAEGRGVATEEARGLNRPGELGPGGSGALYNGMINPLLKFPIKGALWCEYDCYT